MQISVTDAKAKLTELVRRAEADEEKPILGIAKVTE